MRWCERACGLLLAAALLLPFSPVRADDVLTLTVDGTVYRLDGIDPPEADQNCLDEAGKAYRCGARAAEELTKFIAGRQVICTDLRAEAKTGKRRMGQCYVDGIDLNHWLVENGWAVGEPTSKGRFQPDEDGARAGRLGLWKGCFVVPDDFRHWRRGSAILAGASCAPDARQKLFPDELAQPAGFTVKGSYALRAMPYSGIYHLKACGSYRRTRAQRWFRTEDDAIAAGFRLSYTCGWW